MDHVETCIIFPLSPNSDQPQFSPNDIHTMSRDYVSFLATFICFCVTVLFYRYLCFVVNQIKLQSQLQSQLNDHQRENALIFPQILSTYSLKKCMEISLENLLVIGA